MPLSFTWQPGAHGCQQARDRDIALTVERFSDRVWNWWVHHYRGRCLAAGEQTTEAKAKTAAEDRAAEIVKEHQEKAGK